MEKFEIFLMMHCHSDSVRVWLPAHDNDDERCCNNSTDGERKFFPILISFVAHFLFSPLALFVSLLIFSLIHFQFFLNDGKFSFFPFATATRAVHEFFMCVHIDTVMGGEAVARKIFPFFRSLSSNNFPLIAHIYIGASERTY
jgi:hypothetical protein